MGQKYWGREQRDESMTQPPSSRSVPVLEQAFTHDIVWQHAGS